MLSRELQPLLRPYASILDEALKDKRGTPPALLRLVIGKEEAAQELLQQLHLTGDSSSSSSSSRDSTVLLPQHRAFVLPIIIRLLLSKTQTKM